MSFETKDYDEDNPVHVRTHRRVLVGDAAARYLERGPAYTPHLNDWRRAVARPGTSSWIRSGDRLVPRDRRLESKQASISRATRVARVGHPITRVPVRRIRNPASYNRRYQVYSQSPYTRYARPPARHTVRGRSSVSDRAEFDIGSVAPPAARRRRVSAARGSYYTQQTRRRRWW